MEATSMSFKAIEWISNLWVHQYNGLIFSSRKEWAVKIWKDIGESSMHIAKWKMPIWKGYIYDSGKGKIINCGNIHGFLGFRGKER